MKTTRRGLPARRVSPCPLRPIAWPCLAVGREHACTLCAMVDLDAPLTVRALGVQPGYGQEARVHADVAAQLERCWGLTDAQKARILDD